ncbi:MAG: phage holin family protein [Acidobacteriota bacterium]
MKPWIELFRGLGNALFDLLRAEIASLRSDLTKSGKSAGIAFGLLLAAAMFAFWTLGVLTYALVQVVAIWVPLWAAGLIVSGVFVLVVTVLAAIAMFKLKRLENPGRAARRHLDDVQDWWNHQLLAEVEPKVLGESKEEPR